MPKEVWGDRDMSGNCMCGATKLKVQGKRMHLRWVRVESMKKPEPEEEFEAGQCYCAVTANKTQGKTRHPTPPPQPKQRPVSASQYSQDREGNKLAKTQFISKP